MADNIEVSPDEFGAAFSQILSEYDADVKQAMSNDIDAVAKTCVDTLKATSPYRKTKKGRHYRNGWRATAAPSVAGLPAQIVHNATDYQLTHLLEHGHGGPAPAAAHPHIEKAANEAFSELLDRTGANG